MFSHNSYKTGPVLFDLLEPEIDGIYERYTTYGNYGSNPYISQFILNRTEISKITEIITARQSPIRLKQWIGKRLQPDFWMKLVTETAHYANFERLSVAYKDWVTLPRRKSDFLRSVLDAFGEILGRMKAGCYHGRGKASRNKIKRLVKDLYKYQA